MSADRGYTLTRRQLLAIGRTIAACDTFTIDAGHSRTRCVACDGTEHEHIIAALVRKPAVAADPSGGVQRP